MRRSGAESLQTLEALELRGSERAGRILRLEGLDTLRALRSLDVASNALKSLAPLAQLPTLTTLDASGNQLASLEGLQHLCGTLRDLDLTANAIAQLPGWLGGMRRLEWLGLAHNRLAELSEFGARLRPLPQLARLGIAGNPLAALPQARLFVVNCCRGLHQIDERPVGVEDVREAAARFDATRADELAAEIASVRSELAEARAHASAETRAKEKAEERASAEASGRQRAVKHAAELEGRLAASDRRLEATIAELREARASMAHARQHGYQKLMAQAEEGTGFSAVAVAREEDVLGTTLITAIHPADAREHVLDEHAARGAREQTCCTGTRKAERCEHSERCAHSESEAGGPTTGEAAWQLAAAPTPPPRPKTAPPGAQYDALPVEEAPVRTGSGGRRVARRLNWGPETQLGRLNWGDSIGSIAETQLGRLNWGPETPPAPPPHKEALGRTGGRTRSPPKDAQQDADNAHEDAKEWGGEEEGEEDGADEVAAARARTDEVEIERRAGRLHVEEEAEADGMQEEAAAERMQELECLVLSLQHQLWGTRKALADQTAATAAAAAGGEAAAGGAVGKAVAVPMRSAWPARDEPVDEPVDEAVDEPVDEPRRSEDDAQDGAQTAAEGAMAFAMASWAEDRVERLARSVFLARPLVESGTQTELTVETMAHEEAAVRAAAAASDRAVAAAVVARREVEAEVEECAERMAAARADADAALTALAEAEARYQVEKRRLVSEFEAQYACLEAAAQAEADGAAGAIAARERLEAQLATAMAQLQQLEAGYELSHAMLASKDQQIAALRMLAERR